MTTFTTNRDGGKTNEEGHIRFQTKVWSGAVATGLQAVQRSPLAMGINVSIGDAKVDYSTYSYTVWTNAVEPVATATADPSNPRIDRIVGYVDRSVTPSSVTTNNPGLLKFMSIAGTPSASPARPSNVTVQAAVGASNPYFDISNVLVGTGVTQITTGNITDTRLIVTVDTVDGIHASATPVANQLLALDANALVPTSVFGFANALVPTSVFGLAGYGKANWSNGTGNYSTNSITLAYIDSINAKVTATIRNGALVVVTLRLGGVWNSNTGYGINLNIGVGNNTPASTSSSISPASWTGIWSSTGANRVVETLTFYLVNVGSGIKTFYPLWATSNTVATAFIGQYSINEISVSEIV